MHIAIASYETMIVLLLHLLLQLLFIVRVMLRPHRQPASRIAWVVVIFALPIAGMLLYIFFGEMNIGRKRVARLRDVVKQMPDFPEVLPQDKHNLAVNTPLKYQPLFCVGQSINQSF